MPLNRTVMQVVSLATSFASVSVSVHWFTEDGLTIREFVLKKLQFRDFLLERIDEHQ